MFNCLSRLGSGKNPAVIYYIRSIWNYLLPHFVHRWFADRDLLGLEQSSDYEYIMDRVDYYNQLEEKHGLDVCKSMQLKDLSVKNSRLFGSRYLFDAHAVLASFPQNLRFEPLFGDITYVPEVPSIVKSRPLALDVKNSVVLKLDAARHFVFLNDKIPFKQKQDKAIFMTYIGNKQHRRDFFEKYFTSPLCRCGDVSKKAEGTPWHAKKISLWEHLKYKFILTIEGNDVATNLKWVMSSSSIAVMPRPRYETWFMEGRLRGGEHYIEIASDYSDFEQKNKYYIEHPEECERIIRNANAFVDQFRDQKRESIISQLVARKYFKFTNQGD